MLYVSEMAALEKVNVPGELVETFERATFSGKNFSLGLRRSVIEA